MITNLDKTLDIYLNRHLKHNHEDLILKISDPTDGTNGQVWTNVNSISGQWQPIGTEQYAAIPSATSGIGIKGQKSYDGTYLYECIGTNQWVRWPAALF